MAGRSFEPGLLVNLTAALESVAEACCLPKGWVAKPSFRLTPQGASLLVTWSPVPAVAENRRSKEVKKKKRKSKAARERSANRAAAHKVRKQQLEPQRLNPAAPEFTMPAAPAPNSVLAGPPAVESERGGAVEDIPSTSEWTTQILSQQPGRPEPGPAVEMAVEDREKRKREELEVPSTANEDSVAVMLQQIGSEGLKTMFRKGVLEAVVKGDAQATQRASLLMDSLEGQGAATRYVHEILSGRGVT